MNARLASLLAVLILAVGGLTPGGAAPPRAAPSTLKIDNAPQTYRNTLAGTVAVVINGRVNGTGWVVDAKHRWVITNHHVVRTASGGYHKAVKIEFPEFADGRLVTELSYYLENQKKLSVKGVVLYTDRDRDLALIEVAALPPAARALPLAKNRAAIGEEVLAVGNAGAYSALWVLRTGHVQTVSPITPFSGGTRKISAVASDVMFNPGDSGGPLVNARGELVGINFMGKGEVSKISYSIDVRELKQFLGDARGFLHPLTAADYLVRGKHQKDNKKYKAALADYAEAMQRDGEMFEAYEQRAWVYNELRQFPEAVADTTRALEINPRSTFALRERAYAREQLKEWARAIADMQQVVDLEPRNGRGWGQLGKDRLENGDKNGALTAFNKAIDVGERSLQVLEGRGDCYAALKDYRRARNDYQEATLRTRPGSPEDIRLLEKLEEMEDALG